MAEPTSIACIFRSVRTTHSNEEYRIWAHRMNELVQSVPGYVSHVSYRDAESRSGVTIAYFTDLEAVARWRDTPDHQEAQRLGREAFYEEYSVQIATVVREYDWHRPS